MFLSSLAFLMALRMSSSPSSSTAESPRIEASGLASSARSVTEPSSFRTNTVFSLAVTDLLPLARMPMMTMAKIMTPIMVNATMPVIVASMYLKNCFILL